MLSHIQLLRRVFCDGVGAWQVGYVYCVLAVLQGCLLGVYRHARVVAHMLVAAGSVVEDCRFAAVRISHEGDVYLLAFLYGGSLQPFVYRAVVLALVLELLSRADDFYHLSLGVSQRDAVAHYLVFHRVLERGALYHGHLLAGDESHFVYSLAESAVSQHFSYVSFFSWGQFRQIFYLSVHDFKMVL